MTAATATRRRTLVVLVTLVTGTACLAVLLRLKTGDDRFLPLAAAVAVVWAVGALASGPVPVEDRRHASRGVGLGAVVGVGAVAACLVGGLVAESIPALREPARELLAQAAGNSVPLVAVALLNGIAEELFFRGALYDAVPGRLAVVVTTGVYALTTLASGVVLLTVAAVLLGLVTALLRRRTGGVLAPGTAHLTWTLGMLTLLPSVLGTGR